MENKKIVIIRADASVRIGSGHVMRCLTLAGQLKQAGNKIVFICSEMPGSLAGLITEKGYEVLLIPLVETSLDDAWKKDLEYTANLLKRLKRLVDLLVVDHYGLDARWEIPLRKFAKQIMVIDDLANRHHDCDILLDQNLYQDMDKRYEGLVPKYCRKLLGPKHVLLRSEFYEARKNLRPRDGIVRRILIFFGGSDPANDTAKALRSIKMLNRPEIAVDVVVGMSNPHKAEIQTMCSEIPNTEYYCQVNNMADLMAKADLAIGAGGTATWERCFLGLPTIIIATANNQLETLQAVTSRGLAWNLGTSNQLKDKQIVELLNSILGRPSDIRNKEIGCKSLFKDKFYLATL